MYNAARLFLAIPKLHPCDAARLLELNPIDLSDLCP
jgi:hypothetical protein